MSEQLTPRFRTALTKEVAIWKTDGLISDETAAAIIARYPVLSRKSTMVGVVTIVGAVLVGLGTLLFIGANWDAIPKLVKLLLILAFTTASYAAGFGLLQETVGRPRMGAALLLLGNIFYGAGIWLVSQMFNLDLDAQTGLLLWGSGTAAMTLVTRQAPIASLTSIIFACWVVSWESHAGAISLWGTPFKANLLNFVGAFAASLALSHIARSRTALIITLVSGALWVSICSGAQEYGLAAYAACIYLASLWYRRQWPLFGGSFTNTGAIIAALAFFASTFDRHGVGGAGSLWATAGIHNLAVLVITAVIIAGFVSLRAQPRKLDLWFGLGMALTAALLTLVPGEYVLGLGPNLAFIALLVGMIATGLRINRPGLVNTAMVFVVLDIVARYFDFFYSMMDRSLFFIIGGLVLMVGGALVEKSRRRLVHKAA